MADGLSCQQQIMATTGVLPVSTFNSRKGERTPAIRVEGPGPLQDSLMGVPRKVTRLSALGHKRTFAVQNDMSALPPKADICSARAHVRFVPIADIAASTTCPGFRDFTPLNRQTAGQRHHDGKPASDAKMRQNTHC